MTQDDDAKLLIVRKGVPVKIEANPVIRGTLYTPILSSLQSAVIEEKGAPNFRLNPVYGNDQSEVENEQSYNDGASLICWGKIVAKVDGETVRTVGSSYVKDRTQAFHLGKQIPAADPATFEIISDSYSRDKARAYFWMTEIPGARPETFQVLDRSYGKDDQRVYHHKDIDQIDVVEGADAANFKVPLYDEKRGSEAYDGKNYFMSGKMFPPL